MKYISKIAFTIILSLTFFACGEEQQIEQVNLNDNSKNVIKLINSFDLMVKVSISNSNLNSNDLGNLFIEESIKNGLRIVEIAPNNNLSKSNNNDTAFSNKYIEYSNTIQEVNNYSTKEEYKGNLLNLHNDVVNSIISIEEKQLLVDNIRFMVAFVDWMGTLENSNTILANKSTSFAKEKGWWESWGKCAAGIIGGALTGSVAGCGVGAAVGAAVGTIVPGAGTAAGAVTGCVAGGVVGAIGGGLSGAADHC